MKLNRKHLKVERKQPELVVDPVGTQGPANERPLNINKETNQLLKKVVGSEHDFEWYPTSDEIIKIMGDDLKKECHRGSISFLDCGAGNGKVIQALSIVEGEDTDGRISQGYAIEKSRMLLDAMDKDIFVVGTEFMEQTLLDKKVDVVFSNPPYTQYEFWSTKIIKEANASLIYLVLPKRWEDNNIISLAIKTRDAKVTVLHTYDFRGSENRKARTEVNLIKIELNSSSARGYNTIRPRIDPFIVWFDETFNMEEIRKDSTSVYEKDKVNVSNRREKIAKALTSGGSFIDRMEEMYIEELNNLIGMYQNIMGLDSDILQELDVNKSALMGSVKLRIEGLKSGYWLELFNRLETITSRLTVSSRKKLLDTLQKNTHVDFSAKNAYAIVLWVVKQANTYFDSQLINVFESLFSLDNIHNYKSNDRVFNKEDWRWNRGVGDASRYTLDYRIVHVGHTALNLSEYSYDSINGLALFAADFLNDLTTIGNNLGYKIEDRVRSFQWDSGVKNDFMCTEPKTKKLVIFMSVRAYKNGNMHIKFNQKFMKTFNVEFGRLKGWLRDKKQAAYETGYHPDSITTAFNTNFCIEQDSALLLPIL